MNILKSLFFFALIAAVLSYKYNIPGTSTWPSNTAFNNFKNSGFTGKVFLQSDKEFQPFTINTFRAVPKPAVIVQPVTVDDVIKGLQFAQTNNIRISVQSTGRHQDQRNIFDNSVHFDLSKMTNKTVNLVDKTLTLGPGNNWGSIVEYLISTTNDTMAAVCGDDPGVGIYGWTAGGGHGRYTKLFGLGADNLLSVNIVLANLTVVTASATQNPELFRAIRGAGGPAFGIVTSLTVKLVQNQGTFYKFDATYPVNSSIATTFGNWLISAPNYVSGYYSVAFYTGQTVTISAHCFGQGNNQQCDKAFDGLKNEATFTYISNFTSYYQHLRTKTAVTQGSYILGSIALNSTNIVAGIKSFNSLLGTVPNFLVLGDAVTGGVAATLDTSNENTAISQQYRNSLGVFAYGVLIPTDSDLSTRLAYTSGFDQVSESLKKISDFVYWNIPQRSFPAQDWQSRYWGGQSNYNRLLTLKQSVDPNNFFNCYHCVGYNQTKDEVDPIQCPQVSCSCTNTPSGTCAPSFNTGSNNASFQLSVYTLIQVLFMLIFVKLF